MRRASKPWTGVLGEDMDDGGMVILIEISKRRENIRVEAMVASPRLALGVEFIGQVQGLQLVIFWG